MKICTYSTVSKKVKWFSYEVRVRGKGLIKGYRGKLYSYRYLNSPNLASLYEITTFQF